MDKTIIRVTPDNTVTLPRKEYDSLLTSRAALAFILNAGTDCTSADRAVIEAVRKTIKRPEDQQNTKAEFTKENPEEPKC